jgi:Lar family restriction alleviation protein
MDKQIELKPCPFCGYKSIKITERRHKNWIAYFSKFGCDYETIIKISANVICNKCHAKGGTAVGNIQGVGNMREVTKDRFKIVEHETIKQKAIELWNRRVNNG